MTTELTVHIEDVDYWGETADAESLTHKTLVSAVKGYIDQECGITPRHIFTPPPGFSMAVLCPSEAELRLVQDDPFLKIRKARFLECLRALPPRSFFAWRRGTVHRTMVESIAAHLAETTVGYELEELLDPNGLRPCDRELQHRLEVAFAAVLQQELVNARWKPWHCEPAGQVTLTPVQMEAMMREHYPHWFE